jgi:hypothetical protein
MVETRFLNGGGQATKFLYGENASLKAANNFK